MEVWQGQMVVANVKVKAYISHKDINQWEFTQTLRKAINYVSVVTPRCGATSDH